MSFMSSRSFIAFWKEAKPQSWKITLIIVVAGKALTGKGYICTDAGLSERMGTHIRMEAFARERLGSKSGRMWFILGIGHLEGLGYSWGSCGTWGKSVTSCCFESISFRSSRKLSHIIVTPHLMFTPGKPLKVGRCERRWHYRVVLEWVALSLGHIWYHRWYQSVVSLSLDNFNVVKFRRIVGVLNFYK